MVEFMKKDLKILIVGDGCWYMDENALADAFIDNGYQNTTLFSYDHYMKEFKVLKNPLVENFIYKFQNKFSVGPGVDRLNREIIQWCKNNQPDLVFMYRCRAVYPKTIRYICKLGSKVFSYNNDNPFSTYYPKFFWRHYKKSIPYCDVNFVYRESNIQDCIQMGSKRTDILRSYYIEKLNYPIQEEKHINDIPEVVFLGHYENDSRKEYLEALADNGVAIGIPLSWKGKINSKNIKFLEGTGDYYNEIICSAKIALCFFSTLNKDTYTRRCFEIPATQTLMISIYTKDLASMFTPDKEVVYFESKEELIEKVKYYLSHNEERKRIGQAGYARLKKDGHEARNRATQIMECYNKLNEEEKV